MAGADVVGRWMLDETRSRGQLYRNAATQEIAAKFGYEFVHVTDTGGLVSERKVLKAFEKPTKTKVAFVRPSMYWRTKKPGDEPGRRQYG